MYINKHYRVESVLDLWKLAAEVFNPHVSRPYAPLSFDDMSVCVVDVPELLVSLLAHGMIEPEMFWEAKNQYERSKGVQQTKWAIEGLLNQEIERALS